MWLCTHCNECSDTCPRDANPGEFVQAMRKWSIAQYDPTKLSSILQTNSWFAIIFLLIIGVSMAIWAMVFGNLNNLPTTRSGSIELFENGLVDKLIVEIFGVLYMGVMGLIVVLQIFNLFRSFAKKHNDHFLQGVKSAWNTRKDKEVNTYYHLLFSPFIILKEIIFSFPIKGYQQMSKTSCEEESKPWLSHLSIVIGFFGLLLATGIDFIFKPDANEMIPIWAPQRALGIFSTILFLGGLTFIMYYRLTKKSSYYSTTTFNDWLVLILFWLIGFTGIMLTASLYIIEIPVSLSYILFFLHMVIVIQAFTFGILSKFSHVWLRPFAILLINSLERRNNKISMA